MIALKIESVKEFMGHLFAGDMFDRFHVNVCEVTTFATFHVDGRFHEEWLDTDEKVLNESGLVTWCILKPYIFSIIKGKKTPAKMKIDFCHYLENGDCGSIRIEFVQRELFFYTGYMQKEFSMDRGKKMDWDENCMNFIKKNEIASTHLE